MKLFLLFLLVAINTAYAQKIEKLDNVLVVAQFDKEEDRFSMEIAMTEMLIEAGIKAYPSLNFLKRGSSPNLLIMDSIQNVFKAKGITKVILVSVRGFDTKYKNATVHGDLASELSVGHLFPIFRDEATSVTFEFNVYDGLQFAQYGQQRIGAISSRDGTMKKFKKKMRKRISRRWVA